MKKPLLLKLTFLLKMSGAVQKEEKEEQGVMQLFLVKCLSKLEAVCWQTGTDVCFILRLNLRNGNTLHLAFLPVCLPKGKITSLSLA